MQEVKIQDLIVRCIEYFKEHCYTENRISKYKSLWRTGIVHFMTERSIVNYSPSIGADFVSSCHLKGEIRHQEREKIRSVQVLDDMLCWESSVSVVSFLFIIRLMMKLDERWRNSSLIL